MEKKHEQIVKQGRGEHREETCHLPSEEEEVIFRCCCWWQPCRTPAPKAWRRRRQSQELRKRKKEGRRPPGLAAVAAAGQQLRRRMCSRRRRSTGRRNFGRGSAILARIWRAAADGARGLEEQADGRGLELGAAVSDSIYLKPNGPPLQPTTGPSPQRKIAHHRLVV